VKLVSIICPLHNKVAYIKQTIHSVLSQTIENLEMLVVENHSSDSGPEVVAAFAERDARVRLILAPPEVHGPGAARNFGLASAQGEWILFLDADDLLEVDYLEQRLAVLKSYPEAKIIAGPWKTFYPEAPDIFEIHFPNGWKPPFSPPPDSIYAYSPWALHAAMIRRDALGGTSPWIEELDDFPAEDNAFWFRVLYGKKIHWNECGGALYRKHTENSRDVSARKFDEAFQSTWATLSTNRRHLENQGAKVSSQMASIAVRVYENLLKKSITNQCNIIRIRKELKKHLAETSLANPAMFLRRLKY